MERWDRLLAKLEDLTDSALQQEQTFFKKKTFLGRDFFNFIFWRKNIFDTRQAVGEQWRGCYE